MAELFKHYRNNDNRTGYLVDIYKNNPGYGILELDDKSGDIVVDVKLAELVPVG